MRGVVLANEVLDAMPVARFVLRGAPRRATRARAGRGTRMAERFEWRELDPTPELENAVPTIVESLPAPLPDGYVSEVCLSFQPWIASLAGQLEHGVALLIDYGLPRAHLYHPERSSGTLRCHFRHRAHDDPFINVGLQDITAWVDFTRVAEAADGAGLEMLGFTTQAAFLIGAGMESLLTTEMELADDEQRRARLAGEARRLMLPGRDGRDLQGHRARARLPRAAGRLRHADTCRCSTAGEPVKIGAKRHEKFRPLVNDFGRFVKQPFPPARRMGYFVSMTMRLSDRVIPAALLLQPPMLDEIAPGSCFDAGHRTQEARDFVCSDPRR